MAKRILVWGAVALAAVGGYVAYNYYGRSETVAQAPQGARGVSVEVAKAGRAKVPMLLEALGTVTPVASVAIKSRIDSEIVEVHFQDGSTVAKGDMLLTLDSRSIEAQIKQAESQLARDQAQLDGAERDMRRYTELVSKGATPVTNLDNAKTQADAFRAATKADQASIDNLKVQLSYCAIRAPISGRISQASVKVGNFVRSADTAPIATIIQMAPVYVSFTTPQRNLPDIRHALAAEAGAIDALVPGDARRASGSVSMIENTVDPSTGMATVRATMPNENELLWPGTLVNVLMTLRVEDAVVVPAAAVQVSQQGNYVFVVEGNVAKVAPVKVSRTVDGATVVTEGLKGDETVVVDGVLQLTDGARIVVRDRKPTA